MTTPIIDCHSHTAYSGHGEGTIAEAVAQAEKLGLAVYAQTEHLTLPCELDPDHEDSIPRELVSAYLDQLAREKQRIECFGGGLELVCGIEADWLDGRAAELDELCAPFDYVIGSVHFLRGLPLDNSDNMALWEELGVDGVWESYLNAFEDMIRSAGAVNCIGHADLPKVFGDRPSFNLRDAFGDIAALAAQSELIIELNCAGWHKKAGEQYPSLDILELFAQAQVPCTVGCDAHKPSDIAVGVEHAYGLLYKAGYREIVAPRPHTAQSGEYNHLQLI